jgi:DNA-binding transcriptional LysR family regulator
MKDFPIELLRTLVATVDSGSMSKAAPIVERTPSAVSLQMAKLSELVGRPLFERRGRSQRLTRAGETLVRHARGLLDASERAVAALSEEQLEGPVRFGTVQDLADVVLPAALAGFAKQYPGIILEVQVSASALLVEQAQGGELDFCVCFRSRRAPRTIRREPMVWLGHRALATMDPVPLAVLDPPCGFREAATKALVRVGRRHRVVLRTPSLAGLRAALEAGLGVGCRTSLLKSGRIEVLGEAEGLPPLPEIAFSIYVPRPLSPAARKLASLIHQVVAGESAPERALPVVARAAS